MVGRRFEIRFAFGHSDLRTRYACPIGRGWGVFTPIAHFLPGVGNRPRRGGGDFGSGARGDFHGGTHDAERAFWNRANSGVDNGCNLRDSRFPAKALERRSGRRNGERGGIGTGSLEGSRECCRGGFRVRGNFFAQSDGGVFSPRFSGRYDENGGE